MTRRLALAMIVCLAVSPAAGDDAPRTLVRAHVEASGPVAVGQTVRLVVDALVTTWFTEGVELPPLDVPGAVVAQSNEQAPKLTESIDGVTWFGVSRVYLLTPTQPGTLTIPPIALTLHPGQAPRPVEARTAPFVLTVVAPQRPPGAEHALAARNLQVTQHLDRKLDGLRVGASLERTITVTADGVRAMFLPPVAFGPIAGLGVYPKDPHVDDVTDERGTFIGGRRIDAATYVVQAAGRHALPPITVQWWDTQAEKLMTATLPAITFEAAGTPAAQPEIALPADHDARTPEELWAAWRRSALFALAALLVAVALWIAAPSVASVDRRLAAARAERHRRFEASEEWAFDRLTESLLSNDPKAIYPAVTRWLARVPHESRVTPDTLGTLAADPELAQELTTLGAAVYGGVTRAPTWTAEDLARRLTNARWLVHDHTHVDVASLPPLNPS